MDENAIAGLSIRKAALIDQLSRTRESFSKLLLMGRIKAVQREIDALSSPTGKE